MANRVYPGIQEPSQSVAIKQDAIPQIFPNPQLIRLQQVNEDPRLLAARQNRPPPPAVDPVKLSLKIGGRFLTHTMLGPAAHPIGQILRATLPSDTKTTIGKIGNYMRDKLDYFFA